MAIYVVDRLTTRRADPTVDRNIYAQYPTPAGALTDLGFWLKPEDSWMENGSTVVLPAYADSRDQLVADVRALGWDTQPTEGAWFTCRRQLPGSAFVLHLCILEWINRDDPVVGRIQLAVDFGQTWDGAVDAIVGNLVDWHKTMGTPYRHTPGVAAHDSIRAQYRPIQPRWAPYRGGNILHNWSPPFLIRPMLWTAGADNGAPRVKFDQRQAYLAAMRAVILPREGLKNTGVEPVGPGYLRVRPNDPKHPLWTLVNRPDSQGCVGLGTATARFLTEAGAAHEIIDSQTAPGSRLLRTWTERVLKLPPAMAKPVYTQAVGMMNTKTGSIQRGDWYDLVIDQANATMLRRLWAAWKGLMMWPSTIHVDALEYRLDADSKIEQLAQLVKVGGRPGEMKMEETQ